MTNRWLSRILAAVVLTTPALSAAAEKVMPRPPFPIVSPRALSAAEVADVHQRAFALEPQDAEVWFVAVVYEDRACFHARVYFKPDELTPRLRKGRYARLQDWQDERGGTPREVEVYPYAQVSPADRPFGEKLDVPQMAQLPFHWPRLARWQVEKRKQRPGEERTPMSADEVVRLVDAARGGFGPRLPDMPVCAIQYDPAEDAIAVACGVSGHGGRAVFLRQQPSGNYSVVGGCGWSGGMY